MNNNGLYIKNNINSDDILEILIKKIKNNINDISCYSNNISFSIKNNGVFDYKGIIDINSKKEFFECNLYVSESEEKNYDTFEILISHNKFCNLNQLETILDYILTITKTTSNLENKELIFEYHLAKENI